MQSTKHDKKLGKEKLERIIESCIFIENHKVDPFTLDIDEIISIVKNYFPNWENPEELKLDAETLHHIASVVKMQSEWVKQHSSSLYTDPFLLSAKIRQTGKQGMIDAFLAAWSPLIEFEQISLNSLSQGLLYWEACAPLNNKLSNMKVSEAAIGSVSRNELIEQRILSDKEFSEELEHFWQELKRLVVEKGSSGKIAYWDFIGADTYEETVQRAFMISFLVTYGYSTLEIDRLEETIFIVPFDKPRKEALTVQATSVPIAVLCDDWKKWKAVN